jgi:hypothetical protein
MMRGCLVMTNAISREAAQTLERKLMSSAVPLAVFVTYGGSWVATKVTTALFKTQLEKTPHSLMGVYTLDASVSDIETDFYHSGVK